MDVIALSPAFTSWILVPLLIFLARVCDQTIGTLRIILLARGNRLLAPLLGFIEVVIWLVAIRQIFTRLDNFMCYFAYGAGFALGNYVGMVLDAKIALGTQLLRVITRKDPALLAVRLRQDGYGVTELSGEGATGPVNILFTLVPRRDVPAVADVVREYHPNAFYSLEDVRTVESGVFPATSRNPWITTRKGK